MNSENMTPELVLSVITAALWLASGWCWFQSGYAKAPVRIAVTEEQRERSDETAVALKMATYNMNDLQTMWAANEWNSRAAFWAVLAAMMQALTTLAT